MKVRTRRGFLADVGRGMLIAGVGSQVALQLGLAPSAAAEAEQPASLQFGEREALASLMAETPPDKLLHLLVKRIAVGEPLEELVAAAALANARAFGGEDYIGFHTLMALMPACEMARQLPEELRPLPVLKVLYRNAARLQETGGRDHETLKPCGAAELAAGARPEELIRQAVRGRQLGEAERLLAAASTTSEEGFNHLLPAVHDGAEVHRIVLVYRAYDMLRLLGPEHAHTMLRQSVHYCVRSEERGAGRFTAMRAMLPRLLEEHKLLERDPGERRGDDAWLEALARTLFTCTPEEAAEAVAAELAEGFSPQSVGEAISLAANQLVLRDAGRQGKQVRAGKPAGSVHGDSIGVHACDAANAWRNIALAASGRNCMASLVLAGWQVAMDRENRGGDFQEWQPRPHEEQLAKVPAKAAPEALLGQLEEAVRGNDQQLACAAAHRYLELGYSPQDAFALLLRYATSEDGALHAEKYYHTTYDDFQLTRPAFRSGHLVGLARVTASSFGQPAPGYAEARKLLGLG